jgi:hypothetical protein
MGRTSARGVRKLKGGLVKSEAPLRVWWERQKQARESAAGGQKKKGPKK